MDPRFASVPTTRDGTEILVARSPAEFSLYLDWLADYLYRPSAYPGPRLFPLVALDELMAIESEIAGIIWADPYADYPPTEQAGGIGHADVLHREQLARVLSRVPSKSDRVRLLERFYSELWSDIRK